MDGINNLCVKCGAVLQEGQAFCTKCGTPRTPQTNVCVNCGEVVPEGYGFCAKCGTPVGGTANPMPAVNNINAGNAAGMGMTPPPFVPVDSRVQDGINSYNTAVKKKKKKAPFIILGVVLALIIGLFVWCMYQARWSFGQLSNMLSNGHMSCFVSHDFEDATCQHAERCRECGLEVGEKAPHEYMDATCTKPKTCKVCKATEGQALGHAVRIGKCNVCGEKSYELKPELDEIERYMSKASANFGNVVEYLKEANSSYYFEDAYIELAKDELKDAKANIDRAADACGSYTEFSEIKSMLQRASNAINTSSSYISTLAEGASNCLEILVDIAYKMADFK